MNDWSPSQETTLIPRRPMEAHEKCMLLDALDTKLEKLSAELGDRFTSPKKTSKAVKALGSELDSVLPHNGVKERGERGG